MRMRARPCGVAALLALLAACERPSSGKQSEKRVEETTKMRRTLSPGGWNDRKPA